MKTTILVDMDDTMEELLPAWVTYLNNKHHTSVPPNGITDWDIEKFFPELTKEQVFEPMYIDSFWATVQPKPDAVQYVKRLKDDGYNILICTASFYQTLQAKMDDVLFKHFGYLTWENVIVTPHKQMVRADFLVDDKPENLIGGCYKGILMDAPHNRWFNEKEHNIHRAKSWQEIYEIIKSYGGNTL